MAAVREVFEESNVLLVTPIDANASPMPSSELEGWRTMVQKDSTKFFEMCETQRLRPNVEKCVPWSRWITPKEERYRYETHFFLTVIGSDCVLDSRHDSLIPL